MGGMSVDPRMVFDHPSLSSHCFSLSIVMKCVSGRPFSCSVPPPSLPPLGSACKGGVNEPAWSTTEREREVRENFFVWCESNSAKGGNSSECESGR